MVSVFEQRIRSPFKALLTLEMPVIASLVVCAYLLLGTGAFALSENWSFIDGLYRPSFLHLIADDNSYFSSVTLTTVGYGDMIPHSTEGKIFNALYIIVGVAGIASALGWLGGYLVSRQVSVIESATGVHFDEPSLWNEFRKVRSIPFSLSLTQSSSSLSSASLSSCSLDPSFSSSQKKLKTSPQPCTTRS